MKLLVLVICAAVMLASAGPAISNSLGAERSAQQDVARAAVRQGRYVPLIGILAAIQRRTPGVQLDVGLEQWKGRTVYRVRWATKHGRRIDYIVDATGGAILSAE